jgi:hypothetical protein
VPLTERWLFRAAVENGGVWGATLHLADAIHLGTNQCESLRCVAGRAEELPPLPPWGRQLESKILIVQECQYEN